MSELATCYSRAGNPFGLLGPYYDAGGHRGKDYYRGARQPILAYDDMVVEYVGFTTGLGTVIGLRRLNLGGYAGFAHVHNPFPYGTWITKGAPLAWVAGAGDRPGTLWDGAHIHTTESSVSAYSAAAGVRPLSDPGPAIARAISSSTAGIDGTPIEEDDMYTDEDRYRDKLTHEAMGRVETNVYGLAQMLHRAVAASEVSKFILADTNMREQVNQILAVVTAIDAGDLTEDELRRILGETATASASAEQIAAAVTAQAPQLSDIVNGVLQGLGDRTELTAADVANELGQRLSLRPIG